MRLIFSWILEELSAILSVFNGTIFNYFTDMKMYYIWLFLCSVLIFCYFNRSFFKTRNLLRYFFFNSF